MSAEEQDTERDRELRRRIERAIVPPGLRPRLEDIEALLDAVGGDPLTDDEVARILTKAKGDLPLGRRRRDDEPIAAEHVAAEEEQELLALHRSQGKEVPDEIQRKLDALRKKARDAGQAEQDDERSQ